MATFLCAFLFIQNNSTSIANNYIYRRKETEIDAVDGWMEICGKAQKL